MIDSSVFEELCVCVCVCAYVIEGGGKKNKNKDKIMSHDDNNSSSSSRKRKFCTIKDDDPRWYKDEKFLNMTAKQRCRFRAQNKLKGAADEKGNSSSSSKDVRKFDYQYSPLLVEELWAIVLEQICKFNNPVESVEALCELSMTSVFFSNFIKDIKMQNGIWKQLVQRLVDAQEQAQFQCRGASRENVCPFIDKEEEDSWKQLALRHMPFDKHDVTCKSLSPTHLIEKNHFSKDWIIGKLYCSVKIEGSRTSTVEIMVKECAALSIGQFFSKELEKRNNRYQKKMNNKRESLRDRYASLLDQQLDKAADDVVGRKCLLRFYRQGEDVSDAKSTNRLINLQKGCDRSKYRILASTDFCRDFVLGNLGENADKAILKYIGMEYLRGKTPYKWLVNSLLEITESMFPTKSDTQRENIVKKCEKKSRQRMCEYIVDVETEAFLETLPEYLKKTIEKITESQKKLKEKKTETGKEKGKGKEKET